MTIEVTREELFRQVWARPVMQVARDYGISNVALKKICKRHDIPVPGRGYWARRAAGKKVAPAPRVGSGGAGEPITIRGNQLPDMPESVKEARRRAHERERRPENRIDVAAAPVELHPAVATTWDALDQADPSGIGLVAVSGPGVFQVDVARENVPRAMLFLHTLVTAAGERGYRVEAWDSALAFVVDGQAVEFKLQELVSQTPHVPSEEEKLAVRKWEATIRRFSGVKGVSDMVPQPVISAVDFSPSGRLQVALAEDQDRGRGLRRVFSDGETQRLEKQGNAILEGLAVWAAVMARQLISETT